MAATPADRLTVEALFKRAMSEGGNRLSMSRIHWDVSGNCLNPHMRHVDAAVPANAGKFAVIIPGKTAVPLQIDLEVRCRKCTNCLRQRRAQWSARAITEYGSAVRTWLGTFTLSPEEHDLVLNLARRKAYLNGNDFDLLNADEQFMARHAGISRYLTLWLKRIRKGNPNFRYMFVCEAHKSGLPHYHALIHETRLSSPIPKRFLQSKWPHGFSSFKLLPIDESRRATYACKYLNKSVLARVRASISYGTPPEVHDPNPLQGI